MKIYLDNIIFSLQKAGGISVYWCEIIKRLLNSSEDVTYIENSTPNENIFRKQLELKNTKIENTNVKINRYLPVKIKSDEKFIFHSSYYRYCKSSNAINVVTVHDFTYEYFMRGIPKLVNYYQKKMALKNADYIICISENTKKDLIKFHPWCESKKIEVVYNGVGDEFKVLDNIKVSATEYQNILEKKFILFIGDRISYKRFEFAVDVIRELDTEYNLVIVGGKEFSDIEKKMLDDKIEGRYFKIGRISTKELNMFYNKAHCLLYPSAYEGFGIPIAEAMKSGCPVIASNSSSLPEVGGNAAVLIENYVVEDYVNEIIKVEDKNKRSFMVNNGLINVEKFSWDKCYTDVMKIYNYIAQNC